MNNTRIFQLFGLILFISVLIAGCETDDSQTPEDFYDQGNFTIVLDAQKIPGQGQYRTVLESNETIDINVHIEAPANLESLLITKTVNLVVDESFGNQGSINVDASGTSFDYNFIYEPSIDDVDKLIGFTFEAKTSEGTKHISDLTASITLSPKDNLVTKKWNWTSIKHVNSLNMPNEEVIADCEKDNAYLFNADGSMSLQYGQDTAAGSCAFDGLNVYDRWYITANDEYFIMEKHNVFTPNITAVDTFKLKTLSIDKLELEQTIDLSVFGLTDEEIFLYSFIPVPREN
ncbi:hypothetical protein [Gramella sp. AN32]|uniref:Uncharacterized protein n=1 Tax=Christiangramia antarctica TaxID=2058158 RepID=A0ABW5X8K6_9FLAO|nr:hypothetical protein [Gramella sp. AN32]MCM4157567.1 hypothetical protein [Gramella sp. AN32]